MKTATGVVTAATGTSETPSESVTFALTDTMATGDAPWTWNYHSTLVAYQKANSNVWKPDVMAPKLTATTYLAALAAHPQVVPAYAVSED